MADTITVNVGGTDLTFKVTIEHDGDNGAPWDNEDGHGDVSEWTTRKKRAGELVLNKDRNSYRYYDFQGACKKARSEGWDAQPYNEGQETKRQQAAKAARANFEYLRKWCAGEWCYVCVDVILLDDDGNETEVRDTLCGVEDIDGYAIETAKQMADELAHGLGTRFDVVEKKTYAFI